jgi:POT family proton-dependent oligopeptide transporter
VVRRSHTLILIHLQNYIQRPLDGSEGRGALGLGHRGATALNLFFSFWSYVTPIVGATVADQYLGKYKTIVLFCCVYMAGLFVLFVTSLPISLDYGAGIGGFITAIILIGVGTGGIKSNVAPLIADQYTRHKMSLSSLPSGEKVIIDPSVTIQRIYMIFYASINIGSLSLLATPYMERDIGFWSAYLLCLCLFIFGTTILILGRKSYVVRPPEGSVITNAFRAIGLMIRYRNQNAPKQSFLESRGISQEVPWDDHFVAELQRALTACRVFTIYPIYWLVYGQFSGNFVTQAGQMASHGIPNDLVQNFDPLAIILFVPLFDRVVYPWLRTHHIPFPPITRITCGFLVASLAMFYAAFIQHRIYASPPCFASPLCPASQVNGVATGNNVHILLQTPAYILIGVSEIFASVTGLEYAYTKAPPSMKSFVQAIFLLTNAVGAAMGEALTPLAYDPVMEWVFVGLGVGALGAGALFWLCFCGLNEREEEMNALDGDVLEDSDLAK